MKYTLEQIKVGQTIVNSRGYEGVVKEVSGKHSIKVLITKVTDGTCFRTVGELGNCFLEYIVDIVEEKKEERSESYDVEVEANGMIIRMDYKHFEQYMAFMLKLSN